MTTGHRNIQLRQLQVLTELKTFEVSNLARDTKNAESRSLCVSLLGVSAVSFLRKSFIINPRKGKECEKCVPEKGTSLTHSRCSKYLVTARVNIICCWISGQPDVVDR